MQSQIPALESVDKLSLRLLIERDMKMWIYESSHAHRVIYRTFVLNWSHSFLDD
jgi:hypothetical protein